MPHPFQFGVEQLGKVNLNLAVFSKYELGAIRRVPLPPIRSDNFIRRCFNLKRAVQCITLPTSDSSPDVQILHTHLSAFSGGDGTVQQQVEVLLSLIINAGPRWLLAGDFNALPPGVAAHELSDAAVLEHGEERVSGVAPLFELYDSVLPLDELQDKRKRKKWFTHKPYELEKADRTIDYIFLSRNAFEVAKAKVVRDDTWPSDHAPVVATLSCSSSGGGGGGSSARRRSKSPAKRD